MNFPSLRTLRNVLLVAVLAALPVGCGAGSGVQGGDAQPIPDNAVFGVTTEQAPAGRSTWDEMMEAHEAIVEEHGEPIPEVTPEGGGAAEQFVPESNTGNVPAGDVPAADANKIGTGGTDVPLVVNAPGFPSIIGNTIGVPPDTMGAAGPNHLMTTLNGRVQVQTKDGGVVSGPMTLEAFFAALPNNMFDPRVVYSRIHGRWFVTANFDPQLATSGVGFAVSDSDDPTGGWTFYALDIPGTLNWTDFVSIGFNKNWVVLTTDVFTIAGNAFVGEEMWIIDAASAVAGGALTITTLNAPFDAGTPFSSGGRRVKPAVTYDANQEVLYCCSNIYNTASGGADGTQYIRLSQITQTNVGPAWSPLGGAFPFLGSGLYPAPINYSGSWGLFPAAPQMGSATGIDSGRAMISSEPVFRNGHLWFCHTGGLPAGNTAAITRTAAFWYQVDPTQATDFGDPFAQNGVCDGGAGAGGPGPGETISQPATDGTINVTAGNQPGQSFTVNVNGTITDIRFSHTAAFAGTLEIYAGAGNGGALLHSQAVAGGGVDLENFAIVPPLAVTAATTYTFYTGGGNGTIRQSSGNVYTGGIMYNGNSTVGNTDLQFEVVIAGAPLPATGEFYYYPSLAVNAQDDMCMGFTRSSATLFAESVVTGRDGTDAQNTLDPITVAKVGEGSYVNVFNGRNRWGDYSATSVDPVDDLTIWSIQEYASTGNVAGIWWTRHSVFTPLSMTSNLTFPVSGGGNVVSALNCDDPPVPPAVVAECTTTSGAPVSLSFSASAPSGNEFDVELRIDGVLTDTRTAAQMVPGPSAVADTFNFNLPLGGPYLVEVRADDGAGDIDICQISVTVTDTTIPVLTPCPLVPATECTSPAGAVVTFTSPTATDACDGALTVTCQSAGGLTSGSTFPIGTTTVTCTATDASGNSATCMFDVLVQDTTPPVVTFSMNRSLIWSPRSGLIDVLFSAVATDVCDPNPQLSIAVHANEGVASDVGFSLASPSIVRLRGERDDAAVGRIYLVVIQASDNAAVPNVTTECLSVVVPGVFTTGAINTLRIQGAADAVACEGAGGAAPAGHANLLPFTNFP